LPISAALLGFGVSGVTLSLWSGLREHAHLDKVLSVLSLGFGRTTIQSYRPMQRIPFDPFGQIFHWSQFLFMPLYYVNLVVHFFFFWAGHCLTFLASLKRSEPLHAADLVGTLRNC